MFFLSRRSLSFPFALGFLLRLLSLSSIQSSRVRFRAFVDTFVEGPESAIEAAAGFGGEFRAGRAPRLQFWATDFGSEERMASPMALTCWYSPSDCLLEAMGFTFSLSKRTSLVFGVIKGGVDDVARVAAFTGCA